MLENPSTKSDLELFTRELAWDPRPTISKFYSPAIFATFGMAFACGINFFQRKPFLSGIQRHIAFVSIAIPLGMFADQKLDERYARRDAMLVNYIKTHPEDFPIEERIKYKDILQSWCPRR